MDEETIKKLLGMRLKQLRKQMKLTQIGLSEIIGIDQRQIAYIECGNCFPSLKTLNKFAAAFNCQMKDLFDYEHFISPVDIKEKINFKIQKADEKKLNLFCDIIGLLENYQV